MARPMDICLECGIPNIISRDYYWTSGGSILRKGSNNRYVVIDRNQIELIYNLFTFLDGPRAGIIICEARRKVMAQETQRTLGNVMSRLNLPFVKRLGFNRMRELGIAYGHGDMKIRDYERTGRMVVEVTSPYFVPFAEAELKAICETLEGRQPELVREHHANHYVYIMECMESRERSSFIKKLSREVAISDDLPVSGEVQYRTCSSCASPIEASRFSWNITAGTIYDSMRETHVCIISAFALSSIFQELEMHYGPKVGELIMRANKNYTRNLIRGNQMLKDLSRDEFLRSLGIRGEVDVIGVQEKPRITEVRVRNPWHVPVVAGEIAGWCEFKYSEDVKVSWATDSETTVIKIMRAVSRRGRI